MYKLGLYISRWKCVCMFKYCMAGYFCWVVFRIKFEQEKCHFYGWAWQNNIKFTPATEKNWKKFILCKKKKKLFGRILFTPTKFWAIQYSNLIPERSTRLWGHHLHHGIANWEGTQKNCEEKESHVKVPGRGNSKESARRLVEEVDRESTAVEEKDALEKTDARKEGAE